MDPELVAAVFGMTAENAIGYLAGHVDHHYLPDPERFRSPSITPRGSSEPPEAP